MVSPPPASTLGATPRQRWRRSLEQLRYSLSFVEALPQLTVLGLIVGALTGAVIVVFRLIIEWASLYLLQAQSPVFGNVSPVARTALIGGGLLATYLLLLAAGRSARDVSVGHVLDRLHNHQGQMPMRNWIVQFFAGLLVIISGQSVGREGPAIHLGAGVASRLARMLRLPNNSRFSLIACGVAAAIAASFDTPMAGVIFAMEVIVMQYTIAGFVPVILSAVTGTLVSRAVFPNTAPLIDHIAELSSLRELPYFAGMGLLLAAAAALFIHLNRFASSLGQWPLWLRFCGAFALTASVAWPVPEIMGLGYDTLNLAVDGQLSASTLLVIGSAKLCVSAIILGLGVPGGLIGPTLITGACLGGVFGLGAEALYGFTTTETGFYVIIGMTGMMAAVLNAPLAALVAVLELCYNPHMIFPSMLVIVIACLMTRSLFGLDGVFIEQLRRSGRALDFGPARQALMRAGLIPVLNTSILYANRKLDYEQAKQLLVNKPEWIVLDFTESTTKEKVALRAADLATYLESAPVEVLDLSETVDLLAIAGRRLTLAPIHETATLWEALQALRATGADGLYTARHNSPLAASVLGIVTESAIDTYYQA